MCVTSGPATMTGTMVFGYVPQHREGELQRHIVGYQNKAQSLTSGDNFMLLNFAGSDLRLVRGPEHTKTMMSDMTEWLVGVEEVFGTRSGGRGVQIEDYGDYTVFISQSASAIVDTVMERQGSSNYDMESIRQLAITAQYFNQTYPLDTFVVTQFKSGRKVKPTHPIVVSYVPRQPEFITVPGLDGQHQEWPSGSRGLRQANQDGHDRFAQEPVHR